MQVSNPLISVVIPVYNGGNDFRRCLKALTASVNRDTQEGEKRNEEESLEKAAAFANVAQGALAQPPFQRITQRELWGHLPANHQAAAVRSVEIIVVSDGDSDGSWRLAEAFGVKLIRLPESGGPAKARNIGAKSASGDILFFVDADVEVQSRHAGKGGPEL